MTGKAENTDITVRIGRIESYLRNELGFPITPDSPDKTGNVQRVLRRLDLSIMGDNVTMGIQTKVRFMWWANYIIGFAAGNAFMFLALKFLGKG